MGLFSGSKKIYVSSSIYNLAGDELDRPNFLKSSLYSAIMNPYNTYLGETIVGNYLTGPGIMQRSFFNWAVRNDVAGLPTLKVSVAVPVDQAVVSPYIPIPGSPVGLENRVQSAELIDGDYMYWAEKWLFENNPGEVSTEWLADYDSTAHTITIQYAGGGAVIIPATNYDKDKKYIISRYYQVVPASVEPLEVGTKILDVLSSPSTDTYSLTLTTNTGSIDYTVDQDVVVEKVYSDATPNTTTTTPETNIIPFNTVLKEWNKTEYLGQTTTAQDTTSLESWLYIWERRHIVFDAVGVVESVVVNDMGGGVTETVTTTRKGEFLEPIYDHQLDTQETILEKIDGNGGISIYEIGTGNIVLDALNTPGADNTAPGYYPFVPIRLNNDSITEPQFVDLYTESKKAYKRASGGPSKGGSLDKVIEEVEANPDIGDIDYSYIQWGVSVNVFDPACRRYMYEWFKNQIPYQTTSPSTMTTFISTVNNYEIMIAAVDAWEVAQTNIFDPLYGTPKPPTPVISDPPSSTIRLVSDHPQLGGFDNRFTWVNITETNHTGLGKIGAVPGDVWWEDGTNLTWNVRSGFSGRDGFDSIFNTSKILDQMSLFKQTGDNTYSKLTIWGMVHENYIYGGKAVRTTLKEGVNDNVESVFIIPLHAPTVKTLGIKDFTQMTLSNTFITFNSYLVVKKKWYQSFLGMLLIVVAIVVVAALIAPGAVGAASGAFGTNATVGASLGLSGTAAIVAGAVTNAIAAIVIAQAISTASVTLFGEKWGAIIGAIVGFAVSFGMANGFSSLTMSNMLNPQTLLQFSNALANGYTGFVQVEIGEINAEMGENQNTYEKAISDLNDLMRSMGLTDDLMFNQMALTDSVKGNGSGSKSGTYLPETLDQFISRTQMLGSDVVDLTISMVSDYSNLQLTLPKN